MPKTDLPPPDRQLGRPTRPPLQLQRNLSGCVPASNAEIKPAGESDATGKLHGPQVAFRSRLRTMLRPGQKPLRPQPFLCDATYHRVSGVEDVSYVVAHNLT
jgi:hypothetical protein